MSEAKARYSASVDERDTTFCFLDFQQMREDPRMMQKPVTDLLVSGHLAQSESAKADSFKSQEEEKRIPLAGYALRKRRKLVAA